MMGNYLSVVLQIISTLVISRLLTPTEIGIFAVAAGLTGLASAFRDFGVAEYLIQDANITPQKIGAAFAANLLVSWMMAFLLFFSSGVIADFYQHPGVAEVLRIQAVSFLLIPFGAVTMAYFRRQLNYRPIFLAGILSNLASFIVSIAGAYAGFSYLSLAWAGLAGVVVTVGVSVVMRPKDFPVWPSLNGIGTVLHFGKHASAISLIEQVGTSAPEAVIGRVLDMASVAFFSRANGLVDIFNRLFMRSIMQVCLPYFSQAAREKQGGSTTYARVATLVTGAGWPCLLYVAIVSYSAVRIAYGSQWTESAVLAQVLCLAAIFQLPYILTSDAIIAQGQIEQCTRLQTVVQGMRLLSLLLVFPFGLKGICWGLVVAAVVGAAVSHYFLYRLIGLRIAEMMAACLPSALVAVISVAPAALAVAVIGQNESTYLSIFFGGSMATFVTWLGALFFLRHPFWLEISSVYIKGRTMLRDRR